MKAHKAWLAAAGITTGPLFRSVAKGGRVSTARLGDKSVAEVVKTHAGRLGLNAADFSGHSLRAGFLTSAARRGASVFKMRERQPAQVHGRAAGLRARRRSIPGSRRRRTAVGQRR